MCFFSFHTFERTNCHRSNCLHFIDGNRIACGARNGNILIYLFDDKTKTLELMHDVQVRISHLLHVFIQCDQENFLKFLKMRENGLGVFQFKGGVGLKGVMAHFQGARDH